MKRNIIAIIVIILVAIPMCFAGCSENKREVYWKLHYMYENGSISPIIQIAKFDSSFKAGDTVYGDYSTNKYILIQRVK